MKICKVKNIEIGTGKPKICVPIVEKNKEKIIESALLISEKKPDIIEFRADWFNDIMENEKLKDIMVSLKNVFKDTPILFTLRTDKEGGEINVSESEYYDINSYIIDNMLADMVDLEIFSYKESIHPLIEKAKQNNIKIIGSNHHFDLTPSKEEIINRLCEMEKNNVDICKIAVMPKSIDDVVVLIDATNKARSEYVNRPIVTMSMSGIGVITRMSGQIFGSSITFGSVGKTSAPGQVEIDDLKNVLDLIEKNI